MERKGNGLRYHGVLRQTVIHGEQTDIDLKACEHWLLQRSQAFRLQENLIFVIANLDILK